MSTELLDAPAMNADSETALATRCLRRDLFEGVQTVGKAVATRSSLPILMHVLIRQDPETGRVRLTGTDLEMWIEHTLPAQQESIPMGGGAATAPARNLTELLSAMPDADVEIASTVPGRGDETSRALTLRCNRANYKLLGLDPVEFPLLPQVDRNTQFTIEPSRLRDAIKRVLFAVSTDDARPILTGVLMVYKGGQLRLVATDTHRLAVSDCDVLGGSGADTQVVVPARPMTEVLRLLGGEVSGEVSVTLSENQVQFEVADPKTGASTTLISRLIEGTFPSYERVVPQSYDRRLAIAREPLLSAVRRAQIVAREGSANRVVLRTADLDGDGDKLTITATSGNLGNAFEEVEIAVEGNAHNVEIAFNAKYLIDVLSVLDGPGLHFDLTESLRPGVVRPVEDADYFCVLMPMQVV